MSDNADAHEAQFSRKDSLESSGVLDSSLHKMSRGSAGLQEARYQYNALPDREDSQADSESGTSDDKSLGEQGPAADCKREQSDEDLRENSFAPPSGPLESINEEEEQVARIAHEIQLARAKLKECMSFGGEVNRSVAELCPLVEGSKGSLLHRMSQKIDGLEQRMGVLEIRLVDSLDLLNDHVEQQGTFRSHEEKAREKITEHFMSALETALESQQKAIECEIAEFQVNFLASARSMASCCHSSEPLSPVNLPESCTQADAVSATSTHLSTDLIEKHGRITAELEEKLKALGENAGRCVNSCTPEYATPGTAAANEHLCIDIIKLHDKMTTDSEEKLRAPGENIGADVETRVCKDSPQIWKHPQLQLPRINVQRPQKDFSLLQSDVYEFDQPLPRERTPAEPMDVPQISRAQYFL
mmetsp:Transcript_97031/g.182484  ORF Transcript_97031/g.182484 Transcript_97031/m.182484 type:complete len:416 (+) Transcript_97031:89-1336(+)